MFGFLGHCNKVYLLWQDESDFLFFFVTFDRPNYYNY